MKQLMCAYLYIAVHFRAFVVIGSGLGGRLLQGRGWLKGHPH